MQTKQCNNLTIINQHWLCNNDYLTLNDLGVNPKNHLKEQLQQLIPNVFQDGLLNINLLKEALNENDIANENSVFGLYWNGKNKAKTTAYEQLLDKTLLPVRAKSLNFDQATNVIIEGDNLQVLKLLTKAYFNQVDVIYIDPPYNTGNDFVYNDDFKQDSYEYKIANNLIDAQGLKTTTNQKTEGRFHTNWLNMIYPRLELARKLLKDDGVIFISIDDNEQARLKLICDEIFGEQNFVAPIIWRKKNTGGGSDKITIEIETEYILCYAKFKDKFSINSKPIDTSKYLYQDDHYKTRGKYNITDLDHVCSNSSFKYHESLDYEIQAPDGTWFKNYRNVLKPKSYAYTLGKDLFDFSNQNGFIEIKKNSYGAWKAYRKSYELVTIDRKNKQIVKRTDGNSYNNILDEGNITTANGKRELIKILNDKDFSFPKPPDLVKYLINFHRNKNTLVLDFFAGSGTTAQAVMALNQEDGGTRRYILVQLPEPIANNPAFQTICDVTRQRVERAITKYNYDDAGFKYFQLGPTNFDVWKVQSDDDLANFQTQLKLFENADANVNYEAILYELMLKYGLQLDYQITAQTINHHQFWADALYDHLFFLKPQPVDEILAIVKTIIAKKTNQIAVDLFIAETYFYGRQADELKINLCEQIKQSGLKVHLWVV